MDDFEKDLELRGTFKFQLLQNPNFFGNLSELDIPDLPDPVINKIGDTTYEELLCVGYHPEADLLTGIVEVKQGNGYSGGPCTDGSQEYVRFYVDYGDGWVDHGVTAFTAHDLGFSEDLCYAVSIELDPKRRSCCDRDPILPRVRAILSWNVEPPADMPNWNPVWGNRLDANIQIEPSGAFVCSFDSVFEAGVLQVNPEIAKQLQGVLTDAPQPLKPAPDFLKIMEQAKAEDDELLMFRQIFPMVAKLAADKTDFQAFEALQPLDIDLSPFDDFVAKPSFNTTYEELHCVGLDRDLNLLHGIVQIKRPSGFSGDLCTEGSKEYIAFYIDFDDGAGWQYQGTTSVDVHDISDIPKGGLWYQAFLPVDLEEHRQVWCKTGRARIRGILSWGTPPPANDADHIAVWGDREDCWIEIKPLPKGVVEGKVTAVLETIGNMPVDQIDAMGFANGNGVGNVPSGANQSPFGGRINLAGRIAFPTTTNLEYRVLVQAPGDPMPQPWTNSFNVSVTTITAGSFTTATQTQTAGADGWFSYIPIQTPTLFRSVAGDLLGQFFATKQALHSVIVEFRDAATKSVLDSSTPEAFFVDNTIPDVSVDITTPDANGNTDCGIFTIGTTIEGTFSMTDVHSNAMSLVVTPAGPATGGELTIVKVPPVGLPAPAPTGNARNALTFAAGSLPTAGASGTWSLNTDDMDQCGYNIRITGVDRTIVDSARIGWRRDDIKGFCLLDG